MRTPVPFFVLAITVFAGYALLLITPGTIHLVLGPFHRHLPFLDLHAVLAALEGHRAGFDVFLANPFDPLDRVHVYSRWWLFLAPLGLSSSHLIPLGILTALAFLAVALIILRPPTIRSALFRVWIVFSPASILALERGNNDVHLFLLLSAIPPILARFTHTRLAVAWGLLFLSTALKFYPAAAFGIFLRSIRRPQLFWLITGVTAVSVLLFVFFHRHDFQTLMRTIPTPKGRFSFGGIHLFLNLLLGLIPARLAVFAVSALAFLAAGFLVRRRNIQVAGTTSMRADYYLIGMLVLSACFVANTNYLYRLIFLIFLIPFLTDCARSSDENPILRRSALASFPLMLLLCWADTLYFNALSFLEGFGIEFSDAASAYRPVFWILQGAAWAFLFLQFILFHALVRDDIDRHFRPVSAALGWYFFPGRVAR